MVKKILTLRVWILIIAVFLSILAINPNPFAKGIEIRSVGKGSLEEESGLQAGEIIKSISGKEINTLDDFNNAIDDLKIKTVYIDVKTDEGMFDYNATGELGFTVDENLTVNDNDFSVTGKLEEINNVEIKDISRFKNFTNELFPREKLVIVTNKRQYAYLTSKKPEINVNIAKTSNLKKGLDLEGGARVLLLVKGEDIKSGDVSNLIEVLSNRLDVYGLSDLRLRQSKDSDGNNLVNIEIAGASREEVKDLIGKQGKFEAKIGSETVFIGEKKDIPFICKGDGSCSGVTACNEASGGWQCRFEFQIRLSEDAASRQAIVTSKLDVNKSDGGDYLTKTLDLFLDGKEIDSLRIAGDLKGNEKATSILISGPGFGNTREAAIEQAMANMNKLQVILMTGSLPLDIEIIKLDSISPLLGKVFLRNIWLVGILALFAVNAIIFIRYRNIKIALPVAITSISEVILTLGFAALIQWNLDLVSIAGIIAAVGTGVDDQIILIDEILIASERYHSWKEKIKRAFFIIIASYSTTVVAMLPLWDAGAGLVRGFAVTTIVGVTMGVLITRPAFASIAEMLLKK